MFFFKKQKGKSFYTCDEIKEMLIAYHEKGNKQIKRLENDLKYFAHHYDYHKLDIIQEYDILKIDEENNKIIFQDSSESDQKVKVYTTYEYCDKDDIIVEYNDRICLYEGEVYRFGYETDENNHTFLYFGYRNAHDHSCRGTGVADESYRPSREKYDKFMKDRSNIKYLETGISLEVPLYSEKVLLMKKYAKYDFTQFHGELLKDFHFKDGYMDTCYQDIGVTIYLSLDEKKVHKAIKKIEEILKNESYYVWLKDQIKYVHELYEDWYDEESPFIEDLNEYFKQYHLESLFIDADGSISASYMDKVDSFLGHGVHIDVGPRGKVSRFSI